MKKIGLIVVMSAFIFAKQSERAFGIKVVTLRKGNISKFVPLYGQVLSKKMGYVFTPMPGKLLRFTKKEGDFFKKDEIIAYVDRNIPGVRTQPLVIKAPFDGIMAITYAHEGDLVSQAKPLALFYSKEKYIEVVTVSSNLSQIKRGMECILGVKGEKGRGIVESVSYGVDPMTKTGKIRIKVIKDNGLILGDIISVSIAIKKMSDVFVVPLESVVEEDGVYYVFSVDGGRAKSIPVRIGIISENRVQISGKGLKEGQKIVTRGALGLYDGAVVRIEEE